MNERERNKLETAPIGGEEEARAARLRALLSLAYPASQPSEALRQRVAALAARQPVQSLKGGDFQGAAPPRRASLQFRLVLPVAAVLVFSYLAILAVILFPVFSQSQDKVRESECLSHLKQLGMATLMYAQDYDGRLPRSHNWMDSLDPYVRHNTATFQCPSVESADSPAYGYAFNRNLSSKKLKQLPHRDTLPMIYDSSNLKRNATDPVTSLPSPGRHAGGDNIGYADGHVKWARSTPADSGPSGVGPK